MATKRIPFHIVRLTLNIENGHHGFTTRHFHASLHPAPSARQLPVGAIPSVSVL